MKFRMVGVLVVVGWLGQAADGQDVAGPVAEGDAVLAWIDGPDPTRAELEARSRNDQIAVIVDLITTLVGDVEDWMQADSTLQEASGRLAVRTTEQNHRELEQLLRRLEVGELRRIEVQARLIRMPTAVADRVTAHGLMLAPTAAAKLRRRATQDPALATLATARMVLAADQRSVLQHQPPPPPPPPEGPPEAREAARGREHDDSRVSRFELDVRAMPYRVSGFIRLDLQWRAVLAEGQAVGQVGRAATLLVPDGGAAILSSGAGVAGPGEPSPHELLLLVESRLVELDDLQALVERERAALAGKFGQPTRQPARLADAGGADE
jgi:hypothetical protein